MLRQAECREPIPAFRGEARTWCWIGDVVRAIRLVLEAGGDGIFNVGSDADPVALTDAARIACELTGAPQELIDEVEPPPGRVDADGSASSGCGRSAGGRRSASRKACDCCSSRCATRRRRPECRARSSSPEGRAPSSGCSRTPARSGTRSASSTAPRRRRCWPRPTTGSCAASPTSTACSPTSRRRGSSPSRSRRWAPTRPCCRPPSWPSGSGCRAFRSQTAGDRRRQAADAGRLRERPACAARRAARRASSEEAAPASTSSARPVVVKPVDGSAQRGVTEVRAESELAAAFERALAASRTGAVVLEQLPRGRRVTVNGFLLDGEYFPMSVTQRLLHPPPPLGVCIAHRYPSGSRRTRSRAVRGRARGEPRGRARDRARPTSRCGSRTARPG